MAMMHGCRLSLSTAFFLLILQGTAVLWLYNRSPSNDKVHVLLISSWRSGSSFLGNVFSQHPSVFYLMEPAWHVWTKMSNHSAQTLRMAVRDLVRSLFHCDFSVMESYELKHNNLSALFMWIHSRALCSPPACPLTPRNQFSNQTQCRKACKDQKLQKVQEACSTYSHVVYKVVRFFELESLYPLLQDSSLDLRIIHLVRDPRAVMRSRENLGKGLRNDLNILLDHRDIPEDDFQYEAMQEICRGHVRINTRAVQNPPSFLKGRYKMFRFEDVTRNPVEEIKSMYDFAGLKMTQQLSDWIYTLTHGEGQGKTAFDISSRNAADVSQAWRTELPHSTVERVQEVCKEAMSLLGYKAVNSEEEQNDLDTDVLVPRDMQSDDITYLSKAGFI